MAGVQRRLVPDAFVAILTICLSLSLAAAQNKVVVVPLGGAPGNATADDVVEGKTFSSNAPISS